MYIESVPNRHSPPAVLLRESYREAGKVRKRTLANLSKWPPVVVEGLRILLKGGTAVADLTTAFDITRSRPHGHVAAVLATLRKLRLDRTLAATASPERERTIALIVARILAPGSKLATARGLAADTARDSLAEMLGIESVDEDELYAAMDWLLERQGTIEKRLARRHLSDGALVLYDLTSTYFEGRCCPLAKRGYSRDGRRDKLQIVFGLLCNREGCPVAVEVFDGNTADPNTVGVHIEKLRQRFALSRVVLVGDRAMLTEARIREEVAPAGFDWISALRAPAIRELMSSGAVQRSMFDETDLAEIRCDAYPGERLIVCRNERLAQERARKREALLQATEALLAPIAAATQREKRRLSAKETIAMRVGKVIAKYKMAKHFELDITETAFAYHRKADAIAAEAALDGLYIVRTSVPATELDAEHTVRAYKGLSVVERAFRSLKTVDLKVRPIYHYAGARVRAHVSLLTQGARELPPIPPRQNGQRGKVAKSDAHNLWERMKKHETSVLRFAKHPDVAFTNNRAERDLRMSKVKQKVSGCFRTRKYAEAYCRISSYLQSMASQGYNPLVAIQIALAGRAVDNMGE